VIDLLTCPICGVEFEPTSRQRWNMKARPGQRVFCSPECSAVGLKQRRTAPVVIKKCGNCGIEFELSRDQRHKVKADPDKKVACSQECSRRLCGNWSPGPRPQSKVRASAPPKPKPVKLSSWVPYAGVGASAFPALSNPF